MKFEDLIRDKIFSLPLEQLKTQPFDEYIEQFLNEFLTKVESLDDGVLEFDNGMGIDSEFIKMTQRKIINGLIQTVKEYYDGAPFKAYERLNKTLRNEIKDLYAILKQKEYLTDESFYRIRVQNGNFGLSSAEMFHIPFELRGKVSTQRFSIPGFPSLYLGQTLYVCWEELNRPEINSFQAARFKSTKAIKVLDLTPPMIGDFVFTGDIYRYFMTFPLIACCSVKVKNYSDSFKPEYIIPQLLLQWVRENDRIDGIQYKSTHIAPELFREKGGLSNLVLPVKENNRKGHCSQLTKMFLSTEAFSWQLHEFALGGQFFSFNRSELDVIDNKLPKLELIKGRKYPYSYSILGKMEMYLDGMDTKKIK